MKKSRIVLLVLMVVGMLPFAAPTFAQDSAGCTALEGEVVIANPMFTLPAAEYKAGDIITIELVGTGTRFGLWVDGSAVDGGVDAGETASYEVEEDGTYAIGVSVTDSGADSEITFACEPGDDEPGGTICHIPPGNPDAAHTIKVGSESAVEAHLAHGDEEGACPEDKESRYDSDSGVILITSRSGKFVDIYGACVDGNCILLFRINLRILITTTAEEIEIVPEAGESDLRVVIFLLGDSHLFEGFRVFQINIYEDGELLDDRVIILIDDEGNILWDEREDDGVPTEDETETEETGTEG